MPEITTIKPSYSRKVQLEQFEPVEHSVVIEAELDEGEDEDEAYDELKDKAEDMVERAIAARVAAQEIDADDDEGT